MFKYCKSFEPFMSQVLFIILIGILLLGIIGISTTDIVFDLYATKSLLKQISNEPSVQPERGPQQAPQAPGSTTTQPERESQFSSQQQENKNEDAILEKNEQFRDILQKEGEGEGE